MVGGYPVDSGDDSGRRAETITLKNPHGMERYVLCHAVGCTADRTGDMGSMTKAIVAVLSVADGIKSILYSAAEIGMCTTDSAVDDVCIYACSGRAKIIISL